MEPLQDQKFLAHELSHGNDNQSRSSNINDYQASCRCIREQAKYTGYISAS